FNLSRAGSVAGTATQVVIDDNIVDGPSVFTDAGIVLVNPNPTLPAAINEACTPPTGPVSSEAIESSASFDFSRKVSGFGVAGESGTPAPVQQSTTSAENESITSRSFISSPRQGTTKTRAATPTAVNSTQPIAIVSFAPSDRPTVRKPKKSPPPAPADDPAGNPPVIGPGGSSITWNVGTLPAGSSVTITFQVQVDNPYTGPAQVSNQGSISFGGGGGPVLTDDPSVGGASDPTVTPIDVPLNVSISDAKVAEPTSGTTSMLFTVALSAPATEVTTINYDTADGSAVAPGDYTDVDGGSTVFQVGEQIKVIPITVNSDADGAEGDENFTVTITSSGATVVDGTATGTITAANTPGTLLISELRTSGPGGSADDFVEIYNNTDSPHTVAASDASPGYGVFKMGADCNASPVLVGTIPNGTVIPARGHFLLVGSAYSLANYGGTGAAAGNVTMTSDIENDRNVSLFSTTDILALSTTTRFDAVGFGANTGNVCDLQREGTNLGAVLGSTLQYSFFRRICSINQAGCATPGSPKETNDNAADFLFADTAATLVAGAGQQLGAPGPENLASPIKRDPQVGILFLDASVPGASPPNRLRDLTTDPINNSTFGTMTIRRRIANNTGGSVTRLRFRIIDMTTAPVPAGTADLRVRTSVTVVGVTVNDASTCTATGTPTTTPCTVTVQGLTLEQPPNQTNGGGFNSTLSAGTISLGTPLAAGAAVNVQFLLGVQQTGTFRFFIIVEALP
ncbi:MAG: Calx-beta domain-containing protein, partial [Pyrinomonadaceae bacterium]